MNLDRLFRPRSIAVYGGKWSDYVVEQCARVGFDGEIWRVHPSRDGCYPSTAALPRAPDCAFLGINRELSVAEMGQLAARGAGGAVLFASGFGEVAEGADLAARLDEAAGAVPFIGPNCYGFANFFDRVALWPDQVVGDTVDRGVAVIAQSGTISLTLMYQRRSLPVGYVITCGNGQRLGVADLVRYVAEDPRVSAIGMYVEGIGAAADFAAAVERARETGKAVALVKAGRSDAARVAAHSHTGALTGADALHDAFFSRLGVARCETLDELVETLKLFHCHGPLPSNRLVVAGASGGDMAMVADVARGLDIDFSPIPDESLAELDAATGTGVRLVNPLDFHTWTWFDPARMQRMFAALMRSDYALTAFMLDPPDETTADTTAWDVGVDAMLAAARETGAPAALMSSLPESLSRYNRDKCLAAGVAPMQGLAAFLGAFAHAARTGNAWREWHPPRLAGQAVSRDTGVTRSLSEPEGKALLARFGLAVPRGMVCTIDDAARAAEEIGGVVAVKAVREGLVHKTELGGVILGCDSAASAAAAAHRLRHACDDVLVEEMIGDGIAELIVGAGRDCQFGLFLTLGAGGVLAELLKDTVTLLPPISGADALAAIASLQMAPRLRSWRGRPAADVDAAAHAVLAIWQLVEHLGDSLVELDVNPLIVRPAGHGAVAVDTLITLKEA